mmetsp:Transcript_95281/g.274459  ORF Transcript_95281/g.274459 Transcript_95281/m.274459 type:complete len:202 (-) Transcript_95281:940-1545(-)
MPSLGFGLTLTWQPWQATAASCGKLPMRTALRSATKRGSPDCRTGCWRMMVPRGRPHRCQAGVSKQNVHFASGDDVDSTGGSCRKSPQRRSRMPPKACRRSWRTSRPMNSSRSNKSGSSIDTSSMTSTSVSVQRAQVACCFRICATMTRSTQRSSLMRSAKKPPTPAQLWTVWPPTFTAAKPVGAVTAMRPGLRFSNSWMM